MEVFQVITVICAFVVFTISIFLTIWNIRNTMRHNLKSIKPIVHITVADHEDEIYVSIINNGIGPAIIKDFCAKEGTVFAKNLIDLIPDDINSKVVWAEFAASFVGRALKASERLYLIRLTFDEIGNQKLNDEVKKDLRGFLKNVSLELEYTDIYEKETYTVSRNLDWFGRTLEKKNVKRQKAKKWQRS